MSHPLPDPALDQLFRTARTYNAFSGEVSDETLHQLYDLLKFGPTEANTTPARIVFVKSDEAKAKLHAYGIAPPHTRPAPDVSVMRFIKRPVADPVGCPHCGSANTVVTSQFGSTARKGLYKCLDCQEPFDYFKPY